MKKEPIFAFQFLENMANHSATKKSARKSIKRRDHNRYYAKTMRNTYRKFLGAETKKEAQELLPSLNSMIDKLSKKGIVHKNKAANLKSQAAKHLAKMA
jgi:small subunit ribosomal protein S20